MQQQRSLADWLTYIESLHPQHIELGLDRVVSVYRRMELRFACPIITVGGTNGKGSTCVFLEAILMAAGYRTGLYTSPHIHRFNERARLNGVAAPDDAFVRHFESVEAARGETSLTYFEFTTLAILSLLAESGLDAVILEVGLGGRLDAVNILDADVAIVTNIDIDHVDYLGGTRELIGHEKACIFRGGHPAICGDPNPPQSLLRHAAEIGADLWLAGRDYHCADDGEEWTYAGRQWRCRLGYPALRGANQTGNASAALAALEALGERLPVGEPAVRAGLANAWLPGRFQVLPGKPVAVLDVAHNPHAAAVLADNLRRMGGSGKTWAVFGAMQDKDIEGVIEQMKGCVDHWLMVDLPLPRAASAQQLRMKLLAMDEAPPAGSVEIFSSPIEAFSKASGLARENDKIVAFGSFWVVAGVTLTD